MGKRSIKYPGSKSYVPSEKRRKIIELKQKYNHSIGSISKMTVIPKTTVSRILKESVPKMVDIGTDDFSIVSPSEFRGGYLGTPEEVE